MSVGAVEALVEVALEYALPAIFGGLTEHAVGSVARRAIQIAVAAHGQEAGEPEAGLARSSLDGSEVLSTAPGRLRLRFAGLRSDPQRAANLEAALRARPWTRRVVANPRTSTVLIEYDAQALTALAVQRAAERLDSLQPAGTPISPEPLLQPIAEVCPWCGDRGAQAPEGIRAPAGPTRSTTRRARPPQIASLPLPF